MPRYLFGRCVEADLQEIRSYIARDNWEAAHRMMVRFVKLFRLLAARPELGHVREDDLLEPPVSFWPVGEYLVVYLPNRIPIEIVAVVHGAFSVQPVDERLLRAATGRFRARTGQSRGVTLNLSSASCVL